MYRILMCKSHRPEYKSLYAFLTEETNGEIKPVEIETKSALDSKVEELLNSGYAKDDILIVKVINYTIDANGYSDEVAE